MRRQTRNNIVIGGLAGCGLTCWLLYYLLHGSADTVTNVATLSERWHAPPDNNYEEPILRDTIQEVTNQVQGTGTKNHQHDKKEDRDETYADPLVKVPLAEEKPEPMLFEYPKEEQKPREEHKTHHHQAVSKTHKEHVVKHPKPLHPKADEKTTDKPEVTTTPEPEATTVETKLGVQRMPSEKKIHTEHKKKSGIRSHLLGKDVHTVGLGFDEDEAEEDRYIKVPSKDILETPEKQQVKVQRVEKYQKDQTTATPEVEDESVVEKQEEKHRFKQEEEEEKETTTEKPIATKQSLGLGKQGKAAQDWDLLNDIEGIPDRSRQEQTGNRGSLIEDPAQQSPQVYLGPQANLGKPKETTAEEMAQAALIHMRTRKKEQRVDWERFFSFIPNGLQACTELFPNLANKNPLPQEFQVSYLEYEEILKNFHIDDTHIGQHLEQFIVYYFLVRAPFVTSVCETGFGAGHSAFLWLQSNPNVHVYSFDLGEHAYSRPIAHYLSNKFHDRVHVIWGDSLKTLPQFREANKDFKCDIVVIDGGHTFRETLSDYFHLSKMVSQNNLILLDNYPDVSLDYMETLGNVWEGGKRRGEINEIFHCDYRPQPHGFSVGRYILKDLL